MKTIYYAINETAARTAHEMNSMRDYRENEKTNEYRRYVDEAYTAGSERKEKYPEEADRIDYLCDLYARRLAAWYNENFRIESMCPSILVSGGSNFPVRKKEKQNSRRDTHMQEWNRIQGIIDRIKSCGSSAIKSNDERAIEKLEVKIEQLEEAQQKMKEVNAYFRKNKTLDGCPFLTIEQATALKSSIESGWNLYGVPYPAYELTNNSANIRRLKERLEKLRAVKEAGTTERGDDETGIDGLRVVENAEEMRIQLLFDEKPDEEARSILKSWGFKWSPRFSAWQRVLNENGKYAAAKAIEQIKALRK